MTQLVVCTTKNMLADFTCSGATIDLVTEKLINIQVYNKKTQYSHYMSFNKVFCCFIFYRSRISRNEWEEKIYCHNCAILTLCAGGHPLMRNRYRSTNSLKLWRMGYPALLIRMVSIIPEYLSWRQHNSLSNSCRKNNYKIYFR